jgi:hypothetical protein
VALQPDPAARIGPTILICSAAVSLNRRAAHSQNNAPRHFYVAANRNPVGLLALSQYSASYQGLPRFGLLKCRTSGFVQSLLSTYSGRLPRSSARSDEG